jgi:hypothetical protein
MSSSVSNTYISTEDITDQVFEMDTIRNHTIQPQPSIASSMATQHLIPVAHRPGALVIKGQKHMLSYDEMDRLFYRLPSLVPQHDIPLYNNERVPLVTGLVMQYGRNAVMLYEVTGRSLLGYELCVLNLTQKEVKYFDIFVYRWDMIDMQRSKLPWKDRVQEMWRDIWSLKHKRAHRDRPLHIELPL